MWSGNRKQPRDKIMFLKQPHHRAIFQAFIKVAGPRRHPYTWGDFFGNMLVHRKGMTAELILFLLILGKCYFLSLLYKQNVHLKWQEMPLCLILQSVDFGDSKNMSYNVLFLFLKHVVIFSYSI